MPYELSDYGKCTGLHWHTFQAGGLEFAQMRSREFNPKGCGGMLNKLWVKDSGQWRHVYRHDPIISHLPECFIVNGDCIGT